MGAATVKLPAQVVDEQGDTVWYWTPKSIGLHTGHWQVDVVATANGLRANASDPDGLTVVP